VDVDSIKSQSEANRRAIALLVGVQNLLGSIFEHVHFSSDHSGDFNMKMQKIIYDLTVASWTKILIEQYDEFFKKMSSKYEDFSNPDFHQNLDDCYNIVTEYVFNKYKLTRKLGSEEDQEAFYNNLKKRVDQMFLEWKEDVLKRYDDFIHSRQKANETMNENEQKRQDLFSNIVATLETPGDKKCDDFKDEAAKQITEIHEVTTNIYHLHNILMNAQDKPTCANDDSSHKNRLKEKDDEIERLERKLKQRTKDLRDATLVIAKLEEQISKISCEKPELNSCQAILEQAKNNVSTLEAQIEINKKECSEASTLSQNKLFQCQSKEKGLESDIKSLNRQMTSSNENLKKCETSLREAEQPTTTTTTTTPAPVVPTSKSLLPVF
jgi:myosin heavy subunit